MRVAIFGAAGQLGRELVREFSDVHEVTAFKRSDCDIADLESVMSAAYATGPELIVNAAAMTAVDACEKDVDMAFAINAMGPRNLALAARRLDADLVHISTDYVFDGSLDRPYDEWDRPNPLSVYGRSKYGGEREVQDHWARCYLVRTGVVFSSKPPNFALAILDQARVGSDPLAVVGDQVGSPTYAPHLAAGLRRLAVSGRYGLYHAAGSGACSRADMARELLSCAGLDSDRIQDVTSEVMAGVYPAPRPKMAALECRAWRLAGLPVLPPWQDGVRALVAEVGRAASASAPPGAAVPAMHNPPPPPVVSAAPVATVPADPPAAAPTSPSRPLRPLGEDRSEVPVAPETEMPLRPGDASPGVHIMDASADDLDGLARPAGRGGEDLGPDDR